LTPNGIPTNSTALGYDICILTGHIVWAHEGLPCGEWPDLRLARDAFIHHLNSGEEALADKGYQDQHYFENPEGDQRKKRILARHEAVNGRIKQFCCMKDRFNPALFLYPCFFHAVINLTQLMIANGESMYAIDP
jgi:hypothetical protein